ncbi:MAG TPA: methyltransferase domain-containing protein [Acidobacteriaceae bacterium]|nr:methyltransferase domain-containing protein [Acidobacteriaceae bacterium]
MRAAANFARIEASHTLRNRQAFDAWASTYDLQPNPLLMLEERYLRRMLPGIAGRDVLDAGCGSGRWLDYVAARNPRSLSGIDASEKMLSVAAHKATGAELVNGSCIRMPYSGTSFDLILSSFVLSYVEDLSDFVAEMSRVAKDGCDLFLSDMHPDTQVRLGWKRSFADDRGQTTLQTSLHQIGAILKAFAGAGWRLRIAAEPEFGLAERQVFAALGRLNRFHEAEGNPAIFILHLQRIAGGTRPEAEFVSHTKAASDVSLRGARCALGPEEFQTATVDVAKGKIGLLASDLLHPRPHSAKTQPQIDLSGYLLLPGLINAHDHLEFSLFPRLATQVYESTTEWAEDIHASFGELISLHRRVPLGIRLWWGGVRNLLCGVTTVCHHNPLSAELKAEDFPVRVIQRYGWAHSVKYGGDLRAARAATPKGAPFIVHACEGIGVDARAELDQLEAFGVLDDCAVLVHGLALSKEDTDVLQSRGVSLILCPSSNRFLFDQVPDRDILHSFSGAALGSDSPLTGCGDLLDEIRFASTLCCLAPQRLYSMVTDTPAAILRLCNGEGSINPSARADLIAVRDTGRSPAETLSTLSASDVELVLRDGRVQLASDEMLVRLPPAARDGLEPLFIGGFTRWLRAPVKHLLEQAEKILGKGEVKLGGRSVSGARHSRRKRTSA